MSAHFSAVRFQLSDFSIFLFLFLATLYLLAPANTYAQTSTPSATPSATVNYSNLQNYTQYTDNLVISLMHTFGCLTAGISPIGRQCLTSLGPISDQGAVGSLSNIIGLMYVSPPLQTQAYISSIRENFNFAKPAYAQVGGTGNQVISLVLRLWQVSRNFAYIIMTIIFVVIGLMVMFRARINPQTVVSIQAALPGLVVGLIMITFSYFFAALLVDVGFVSTWVVGGYFQQSQPLDPSTSARPPNIVGSLASNENVLTLVARIINVGGEVDFAAEIRPIIDTFTGSARTTLELLTTFLATQYCIQIVQIPAQIFGPFSGPATAIPCAGEAIRARFDPADPIGFFIWLAFFVVMLFTMIRLFLQLLNNYIMILILTFTAPFHFLVSSLPGRQGVAEDWVRNMLCNILAFPAVFAAFYFAAYVLGTRPGDAGLELQRIFQVTQGLPPGLQSPPLFGGVTPDFIRLLIAFGAILATPAIPNAICEAIGRIGRPGQIISGGISERIKEGQGQLQGTIGGFGGLAQTISKGLRWGGK